MTDHASAYQWAAARLTRLLLRRFRSHARLELDFDGRPVVISGPNGAGKTNILEAISQLAPGRGLRGAASEEMALRPDPIGWRVQGDLGYSSRVCSLAPVWG